ncbi:MAG: cob(I)yrinic acid a,c-diamide adenosyltransferase [Acidimicrobiia bacterium]
MKIYTKRGDDGSTGLFFGGRVAKDDPAPEAYGTVDEAVAALGLARAEAQPEVAERLLACQRDLFVAAAELATAPDNQPKLEPGVSKVVPGMVERLEGWIDELADQAGIPGEFVVPGQARLPAALDLARTVIRRAERRAVAYAREAGLQDSLLIPYLNRLGDYVYMLARAAEAEWQPSRPEQEAG